MATKAEIFKSTTTEANALCAEHELTPEFTEALNTILARNLEPKAGGATVNVEDVTYSVDGVITELQCSVSGVYLPATVEFFYEDKAGKGINGLKRLSRQAEAVRKTHIKQLTATKNAIMADVLDGVISPEDGKAKLADAESVKPDYSVVTAELPTSEDEAAE